MPSETNDNDNDGIGDNEDPDDDNDGYTDEVEAENGTSSTDGNSLPANVDSDGDLIDTDQDNIIDEYDDDANGDGIADRLTPSEPGLSAALPDGDNDGIPDVFDGSEDSAHIGLSGSGCSISSSTGSDPLLWILFMLSALCVVIRKRYTTAKRVSLSMLLLMAAFVLSGSLQAVTGRGLYLGVGAAGTSLKPEVEGINFTLDDSSSAGWHALLGYRMHRRWRAELGYAQLGEASLAPSQSLEYTDYNVSILFDALKASILRGQDNLSLFGRLGAGKLASESDLNIVEDSSRQVLFGLGVDLSMAQRLTLRAEAVSYSKDASGAGVSLLYRFGDRNRARNPAIADLTDQVKPSIVAQSRKRQSDTPVQKPATAAIRKRQDRPETSAPNTRPVPAIAAARQQSDKPQRTHQLIGFGVNSNTLTNSEQTLLDEVALDANQSRARLVVTGHTDNQGSKDYNQHLSTVRALSVRNYLILRGVDPVNINVIGYGESLPVAENASSAGRAKNRRVEIDVY